MRISPAIPLALALLLTQGAPVPVDHEPKHHLVLENKWVRVFDVNVPPADSTLYHVHARDYLFITLGAADLLAQPMGGATVPLRAADGEVRFTKSTITHRVVNPAGAPHFHNLTIEIVQTPSEARGQPASAAPPPTIARGRTVLLENDRVRVERVVIEPGDSAAMHTHARPGLVVILHPATLTIRVPGVAPAESSSKAGDFAWNDGPRTHAVINSGTTRFEAIEIDWK